MTEILAALGLKQGAVISGFLGALVSYRFFRELQARDRFLTAACGIPVAFYCGPALADYLKVSEKAEYGIIFLAGALGISALSACVKAMPELITAAKSWITK